MSPKSTSPVLLTGLTSFVGTQIARDLVSRGYTVRGTVRSQEKFDKWIKAQPASLHDKVHYVIVKDVADPEAFSAPEVWADGVEFVAHTASPFHYDIKDPEKDMLDPAIKGTTTLLRAASQQASVKRIVITSSFAAVLDVDQAYRPGYVYTESDWNPATHSVASSTDPSDKAKAGWIYCASKKLAEEAAWDFVKKEKPGFSLTTICPPLIFGPPLQPVGSLGELNTSAADVWGVVGGGKKEIPPTGFPVVVDVRDVSEAHILGLELDVAKNQRYLTAAGNFFNEQTVQIARSKFPQIASRLPEVPKDWKAPEAYKIDSSKAERDLGIKFREVEKVIEDTIGRLLEIEKELGGK